MQAQTFRQIFDQLSDPALLKTEDGWLFNTAAQALCLSGADLQQLEEWGADASLWLARQFFHVSASRVDGELLLILRPDVFFASAARNLASQIRQHLQSAFGCATDLGQIDVLRRDLRARERLCGVNRELYYFLYMARQLELSAEDDSGICHPKSVDLSATFLQMADEARELCAKAAVRLKLELETHQLLTVADPEMVNYVVLSLIANAMVHLPPSGGQITLGLKSQQGQVLITVTDNGGGFSPDLLTHPLWNEPDRRLYGRGLGLGLPLVQRIVAAHGGTVMAFPSPKGSRVVISFPIQDPEDMFDMPICALVTPSGFSMAKVLLSNALPRSVYFPDPDGDER